MGKVNRNFKASVFTHLFCEPEKELGLYNAFSPVELPPDTPVVDLTLTDVLYKDRVNDLAFSVGGKLVGFFEQQSSINENMALRYFIYAGRVYEKLVENDMIYREERIRIPAPEFYVLYTGVKPFPEKKIYRISDSFVMQHDGECAERSLELVVTAYNVNKGYNEALVRKDDTLYGYVTFSAMVRENEQRGMGRASAVKSAIEECIKQGILAEYLKNNGSEVINMLFQEWNWDDAKAVWDEETENRVNVKWQSVVADILADKDAMIAGKDATIADKDAMIAGKDATIADKDAEIATLKAQLNSAL